MHKRGGKQLPASGELRAHASTCCGLLAVVDSVCVCVCACGIGVGFGMSFKRYFATYAVGVLAMLSGASVVHSFMKPDLVRLRVLCSVLVPWIFFSPVWSVAYAVLFCVGVSADVISE